MSKVLQASDWIRILVTFRSRCIICGKEVLPGQAFWSNSAKMAIHLGCKDDDESVRDKGNPFRESQLAQVLNSTKPPSTRVLEMKCYFCEREAGCNQCVFVTRCAGRFNSDRYCLCDNCLIDSHGRVVGYERYKRTFVEKVKTNMNA